MTWLSLLAVALITIVDVALLRWFRAHPY